MSATNKACSTGPWERYQQDSGQTAQPHTQRKSGTRNKEQGTRNKEQGAIVHTEFQTFTKKALAQDAGLMTPADIIEEYTKGWRIADCAGSSTAAATA